VARSLGDADESGQTPLDPDEADGLKVPIATREALNAVEAENIAIGVSWIASRRLHPFPNGNGRHSRLASDCLALALGRPAFSWGAVGSPPAQTRAPATWAR
jgi:fido (protein-threonine AMPylation protein)